jgi:peptidoglycan biosynthesis protein MviN/MurJ (putative lipid II flippase)
MATTTRRPALVTVLVVLVVLEGIGSILTGIVAMSASGTAGGIIQIIVGLVYLAVAKGLLDGRNWARITTAVVAAINLLFAILAIVNSGGSNSQGPSIGTGVLGLIILAVLFSPKANAFFGSREVAAHPA